MECTTAFRILITAALTVAAPARAQDAAIHGLSAAERVGSNVLALTAIWQNGPELGFGFVAGSDGETVYVATANHTLRGSFPEEVADKIELRTPLRPWDPIEGALLPVFEPAIDLGVVAVPAAELDWKANVLPPPSDDVELLDPVWTIRRNEATVWEVNLDAGILAGRNPVRHELLVDELPVFPGSSGSPVLAAGGLVGMIVRDSAMGGTTAIEIAAIRQQFAAWNLPWALTGEPNCDGTLRARLLSKRSKPARSGAAPGRSRNSLSRCRARRLRRGNPGRQH